MAHLNEIKAGIIGHAIGDALGVPAEFKSRTQLAHNPVSSMEGYGSHGMPAGTWSDDTSMEIALLQSLIDCKCFDYRNIMDNFCRWLNDEFTATGVTFDVGGTCSRAIQNYRMGMEPLKSGEKSEHSNGNGSLMRILPVAYVCHDNGTVGMDRYELVRNVSSLTHAHEISVLGCYIYVNFVCHLLDGDNLATAYQKTQQDDYSMVSEEVKMVYHRILVGNIVECKEDDISSSGYVVHSLEAALWCLLNSKDYKDAVLKAVNLGSDTDTVGAIAGSMAGIHYGYDSLPQEWVKELKRSDYLLKLCEEFATTKVS